MKKYWLAILCLLLAVWFLYGQTGSFGYLRLDDPDYTFRCAFVKDGLSLSNIAEAFTNARHGGIWMPLTYISYMCDISLFGSGAGPHHLVNTALHSANALLLFWLLLCCFPKDKGRACLPALLAAMFWAIHPQRAEAVAWIASRKELLCGFFTLLGLIAWRTRHNETLPLCLGRNQIRRKILFEVLAVFACACACMSKPTGMCFPFLAFAIDWFATKPNAEPLPPDASRKSPAASILDTCRPYLPCLIIAVATGTLALFSQTHPEGHTAHNLFTGDFLWRTLNAMVAVGLDCFQLLVPYNIHLDYRSVPGQFPIGGILGLVTLVIGMGLLTWLYFHIRQRRTLLALLLFFLASILPTLGLFGTFGEHARADRFLYLPMMAVSLAICQWLVSIRRDRNDDRVTFKPIAACGIPALFVYLVASFPVVAAYESNYLVFSRTISCDPENWRALRHVANDECARNNRLDRGIELYRRSQSVSPHEETAEQLAYALMRRGSSDDYAEIRRLCAVFACDHRRNQKGLALEALGTTAMRQRKWEEAISCLEDAIRAQRRYYLSDYYSEYAFLSLGACYCNVGRTEDAKRVLSPLVQSGNPEIRSKASQFVEMIKQNPRSFLFF